MAEDMSKKALRGAAKEKWGSKNLKVADRRRNLAGAIEGEEFLEQAQDPIHQSEVYNALMGLAPPATGPQQTIDVRSGLAGNQGATQDAARAAGEGGQTAASRADAAVRARVASEISQKYGLEAQDAAQRRIAGGLEKGAEDQWGTALVKQKTADTIGGAIHGGTALATGGIAKGMGIDPEAAMKYGTVS
tara:strand:+ start:5996 stop:6565 length:570 start_codon:yes stop_codon:yes gene_type:complete